MFNFIQKNMLQGNPSTQLSVSMGDSSVLTLCWQTTAMESRSLVELSLLSLYSRIITHAKRKRRELQTFFNQQLFCKIVINNEITGNHFFFLFCLLLIKTVNYWHGKGPRSFYLFWK